MMLYLGNPQLAALAIPALLILILNHRYSPTRSYVEGRRYWNPLVKHVAAPRYRRRLRLLTLETVSIMLTVVAAMNPVLVSYREVPVSSTIYGSLEIPASPGLVVVIDVSGSMSGAKLEEAKNAILRFLEGLNATVDTGLIAFDHQIVLSIPPTDHRDRIRAAVAQLKARGGTMYTYPLQTAYNWLEVYREYGLPAIVVMATDGLPADLTQYKFVVSKMADKGIVAYTIFIGSDQLGVRETKYIAEATGGKQYTAETADKLVEVFEEIASEANSIVENVSLSVEATVTVEHREQLAPYLYTAALVVALIASYERYRVSRLAF